MYNVKEQQVFACSLLYITAGTSPGRLVTSQLGAPRVQQQSRFVPHFFVPHKCFFMYVYVFEDDKWNKSNEQQCKWFCFGNTAADPFL